MTLPNVLTVLRLLAAPCLGLAYVLLPRPLADYTALGLFLAAALTDWLDGLIARRSGQITRFGTMLDPIADKAMVLIALALLLGLSGLSALVLIPTVLILFREIFIAGLREYLGAAAKALPVSRLAKWKTAVQMIAIAALFLASGLQLEWEALYYAMDPAEFAAIATGAAEDSIGLRPRLLAYDIAFQGGIAALWLAAALTLVTGIAYFAKALPLLSDDSP